ncbi:Pr6Pr family membrane protein [Amycolatopsis sp. NPDC006125]|uniref:Pr6Pr family membrane protein n=1 Tax=Amycolatopsis sp. NPDC006125 TaxID=3156730 RepID=UPI0033BBB35D
MVDAFVWPLAWLVHIFTQGAFTDWYPYPFLDVTELGLGAALRNAVLVVVLALAFAALFKLADARMPALLRDTPTPDHRVSAPPERSAP